MNQDFQSPIYQIPSPFDGGLTWCLLKNKIDTIHEPLPPGTQVSIQYDDALDHGTINNIPIPVSPILTFMP